MTLEKETEQGQESSGGRKPYAPPRLRVIGLNADETLQEACKTSNPGPTAPGGVTCVSNNCGKSGT